MSKVAVVTGANQGIGYELARQLAQQGFTVYLGARNTERGNEAVEKLKAENVTNVRFLLLDVTSDASVAQAVATVQAQEDHVDVLVNNAGILLKETPPAYNIPVETVIKTYDVNVFGVIRVTTAFAPLVKKSSSPIIVNLSSCLGSNTLQQQKDGFFYTWQFSGYNTSKAALNHYTVAVAQTFPEARVNAIHPGYVTTNIHGQETGLSAKESAEGIIKYSILIDKVTGPTSSFLSYDGTVLPW